MFYSIKALVKVYPMYIDKILHTNSNSIEYNRFLKRHAHKNPKLNWFNIYINEEMKQNLLSYLQYALVDENITSDST